MTLIRFYRATCACGIYKDLVSDDATEALAQLVDLGWRDACLRCTQTKDLNNAN